jgi:hypothetical protein
MFIICKKIPAGIATAKHKVDKDHMLQSSLNPVVHLNEKDALTELTRLSKVTPGEEYFLFKATKSATSEIQYNHVVKEF